MSLFIDVQLNRNHFALSVTAELGAGITGLFGPSGSGKTTLLHAVAGLIRPDSGRIILHDKILFDAALNNTHVPARKRQIGLVFQDHLLFPHLSVEGNLRYGQKKSNTRERKQQLCEIAELLDITHLLDRKISLLSGGEKQRVALGRAILSTPKLLLLDEPFTGLDPGLKQQLIPYMRKLYEKTHIPMILVSHSPVEMVELADELIFIENGKISAQTGLNKKYPKNQAVGGLCNSNDPLCFQKARNVLIKNHSLQFFGTHVEAI